MRDAVAADNIPFDGGPPHKLETWLGLIRAGHPRFALLALLAIGVGWLPLGVLTALSGDFIRPDMQNAFILDFGAHARFLIAPPLLILAEAICAPTLAAIARHFLDAGLITDADRPRYEHAVRSTLHLMNSTVVEIVTIALAYGLIAVLVLRQPGMDIPLWYRSASGIANGLTLSPAGWWSLLVSLPILLTLFIGWLWRVWLWTRFLWLMSRIDLKLIPAHPDRAAGLRFVATSLRGFMPLGLALGVIAAGSVLNQTFHHGTSPLQFKYLVLGLVVFVVALCAGPLFVFTRRLINEGQRGTFQYGALAIRVGQQLERKWISSHEQIGAGSLEVQDFSAMTDLNSIAGNVYNIRMAPIDIRLVALLVGATLLPFVPILLFVVPIDVILEKIGGILM